MKASESKYHGLAVIDPGQPMLFKFWDGSLNLDVSQNKMSFFCWKRSRFEVALDSVSFYTYIYIYIYIYIDQEIEVTKQWKWQW